MFDQWHQLASYSNGSPEWLKKLSRAPVVYLQPSTRQSVLITSTLHTLEKQNYNMAPKSKVLHCVLHKVKNTI